MCQKRYSQNKPLYQQHQRDVRVEKAIPASVATGPSQTQPVMPGGVGPPGHDLWKFLENLQLSNKEHLGKYILED